MRGLFGRCTRVPRSNADGMAAQVGAGATYPTDTRASMARLSTYPGGRGGKERAASLRAEQRLAPGGGSPLPRNTSLREPSLKVACRRDDDR